MKNVAEDFFNQALLSPNTDVNPNLTNQANPVSLMSSFLTGNAALYSFNKVLFSDVEETDWFL